MPLPAADQFKDGMDIFRATLKTKSDFLAVVDATRQAFEAADVPYRLHVKDLGRRNFIAIFLHQIGGPFKTALTISATSSGGAAEALVHEIKGDNWFKMTDIAERVLKQNGGQFVVRGFVDGDVKVVETIEKTDHSFNESAFIKAVRDLSRFVELEQIPGLVRLISDDNKRSALIDAISTHGPMLAETQEQSASPTLG